MNCGPRGRPSLANEVHVCERFGDLSSRKDNLSFGHDRVARIFETYRRREVLPIVTHFGFRGTIAADGQPRNEPMADDDTAPRPKDFHDRLLIWAKAASLVLIPGAIAFATIWIDAGIKHRQANTEMVRLAVGILQQDPEETGLVALREWSMDVIDRFSEVPLPLSAREELRENPLGFTGGGGGDSPGDNDGGGEPWDRMP